VPLSVSQPVARASAFQVLALANGKNGTHKTQEGNNNAVNQNRSGM
jgi:hypothetical protein